MSSFVSYSTDKSIEEAVEAIRENIKDVGFGILFELNFQDKIREKGFDVGNIFYMVEVCNPKLASQILETNIEMGFVLPCKLTVYEKDGENYIGLLKPTTLVGMIDDRFADEAVQIEEKLEGLIKACV